MKQNLRFGLDRVYEYRVVFITTYSVDSIKRTVLLKVLFKIFIGVSIKHNVHWDYLLP